MRTSQTFFNFVLSLFRLSFKYEKEKRNKYFFVFSDRKRRRIIVASSKEAYTKGNYALISFSGKVISIGHFYCSDGKKYQLEKVLPLRQPNMLSLYDRKKQRKIDGNLFQDQKKGEIQHDIFGLIFAYIVRLEAYNQKEFQSTKAA